MVADYGCDIAILALKAEKAGLEPARLSVTDCLANSFLTIRITSPFLTD